MHTYRPVALLLILALAACANPAQTGVAAELAPHASPSTVSHHDAAVRDATHILSMFRPPAGAHRLTGRPAGTALLAHPLSIFGTPDVVVETSWWSTTGDPQTIVDKFPPPPGSAATGGVRGPTASSADFDWPPVSGVLDGRELQVAAVRAGDETVLRVDGVVSWIPNRPAKSVVPVTATSVTVTYTTGNLGPQMTGPAHTYGPVTVTDPGQVAALVSAFNKATMSEPGARPCPNDRGSHMDLVFLARTVVLARVTVRPGGCGVVTVHVTGGTDAALDGALHLANAVESIAHLPWPPVT